MIHANRKLFVDGQDGKVVIYYGDDDVVSNPLIDLNRVWFHSNLDYLEVAEHRVINMTLPAVAEINHLRHLFDHNLGFKPFVIGGLADQPLAGTTMIYVSEYGNFRSLELDVDESSVYLYDRTVEDYIYPSKNIVLTIYVINKEMLI